MAATHITWQYEHARQHFQDVIQGVDMAPADSTYAFFVDSSPWPSAGSAVLWQRYPSSAGSRFAAPDDTLSQSRNSNTGLLFTATGRVAQQPPASALVEPGSNASLVIRVALLYSALSAVVLWKLQLECCAAQAFQMLRRAAEQVFDEDKSAPQEWEDLKSNAKVVIASWVKAQSSRLFDVLPAKVQGVMARLWPDMVSGKDGTPPRRRLWSSCQASLTIN